MHHEVLDLEKRVLETRNSSFRAAVCKSLIRPVQRLPTDNKWVDSMMNTLQVVRIIADVTPHILTSMLLLEKFLEMSQKSDNSEICACLYDETDIIDLKMNPLRSRGIEC